MIRFFNAYFPTRTVLLGASEAVLTTAAFVLAIIAAMGPFNAQMFIGYEQGGDRIALVVCVFIMCMYYFDLYDSTVLRSQREVFTRLIQVFGAVCIILSLVYSLFPAMRLQQNVFGAGALAAASVTVLWRRLFSLVSTWPLFMERVLVLGDGVLAQDLLKEIHDRRELGIQVVAHISEDQDWSSWQRPGMPAFAAEIDRVTRVLRVRRIIVSMKERRGRLPVESLLALKKRGVMIQDGSELYQIITGKISLDSLLPSMLVFSPGFQVSRLFLLYKRTFSLVFSAVALLLTFPLMLLLAVVIRLDSTGPVIFRQRRIGKDGKIFTLYKFRSMYEGVDGGRPAAKDDARCTRVGRWLRASRIDELPQLWNIFRGDMHLVGPRPFVPEQESKLAEEIPFYSLRWSVRPGATGWAQVNRGYCSTLAENAEKLAYDLFYIKNLSVGLDLLVIFKTFKILLLGRGAR
jgi:exopolysaccharide biosynthesis polyprenyl glycosylphosphotransferase